METKLCRTCGKLTEDYFDIFKEEGLKVKLETCLPINISRFSLLPDTICRSCSVKLGEYYDFLKRSLQSIIILETQFDVHDSSLKSKRRAEKGVNTLPKTRAVDVSTQTDFDSSAFPEEIVIPEPPADPPKLDFLDGFAFFDGAESRLVNEIAQKLNGKRKSNVSDEILTNRTKIFKFDNSSGNRRKNRTPKKIEKIPQICLLCEKRLEDATALANHIFEVHGIDMAQEKKKKLPDLLKITDLKIESFTPDSYVICGICKEAFDCLSDVTTHLNECRKSNPPETKYLCKICGFNDDSIKTIENHVVSHENLLESCKKNRKLFDCFDYTEINSGSSKKYNCSECTDITPFDSYKDFSSHRRNVHQIFHCDLCNKFYGRNSHLWKHVNRTHKGHPSVTCLLCNKTSASKYHLNQHFNKIHGNNSNSSSKIDFLKQKFDGFDFQSVKQSFLKQELLESKKGEIDDEGIDDSKNIYEDLIKNKPAEGEFKCSKCFRGFLRKNILKKHKKNCRPKNQKDLLTRCKSCARIFKDRQSLTKHLINYHTDYKCEICHENFQSKCEIVSHIRFNHPKSHLICSCGNILRNTSDLNLHKKDHKNSFVCHFCGDILTTKIKLKMHILSLHRKILALSCGICLKLFETQYVLKDHVRLFHKDRLKPLTSCTVCGKNYGSKWKTFDHLNKSHGRIFRPCRICLEVFNNESELKVHYDQIHSDITQGNSKKIKSEDDFMGFLETDVVEDNIPLIEEEKMSLLEKRLLGTNHEIKKVSSKKEKIKENREKEKEAKRLLLLKNGDGNNDSKLTQEIDLMQNSSKRTVYVNSDAPSRCEICLKTWPAKKHLWQHYIRCHKSVAATVCGICLKANDTYETLQRHLRDTHPNLLHGRGFGSNFICRVCGRYHNASSKLRLHMAIHENFDFSMLETFEKTTETLSKPALPKTTPPLPILTSDLDLSKSSPQVVPKVATIGSVKSEIDYENLIERVECSSDDDDNDDDEDDEEDDGESGSSDSSEDDSDEDDEDEDDDEDDDDEDDEEEEEEEEEEGDSLESRMLRNMLREKGMIEREGGVYGTLEESSRRLEDLEADDDDDDEVDEDIAETGARIKAAEMVSSETEDGEGEDGNSSETSSEVKSDTSTTDEIEPNSDEDEEDEDEDGDDGEADYLSAQEADAQEAEDAEDAEDADAEIDSAVQSLETYERQREEGGGGDGSGVTVTTNNDHDYSTEIPPPAAHVPPTSQREIQSAVDSIL